MSYLITQTFTLLLVAALLGMMLGWYLTRMSAAAARAPLQARLESAENEARKLRDDIETAASIRGGLEAERQALLTEIDELKSELKDVDQATVDDGAVVRLESELEECREALAQRQAAVEAENAAVEALAQDLLGATPARQDSEEIPSVSAAAAAAAAAAAGMRRSSAAPAGADDHRAADNLRQIKGIGPKIAALLDDLGIRQFAQIAAWTPDEVESINGQLKFKGRIEREQWIAQARALVEARDSGA